ncbi:hypothetical protein ACVIW0_002220 [Bradyrhizobium sp. USDA 4454]
MRAGYSIRRSMREVHHQVAPRACGSKAPWLPGDSIGTDQLSTEKTEVDRAKALSIYSGGCQLTQMSELVRRLTTLIVLYRHIITSSPRGLAMSPRRLAVKNAIRIHQRPLSRSSSPRPQNILALAVNRMRKRSGRSPHQLSCTWRSIIPSAPKRPPNRGSSTLKSDELSQSSSLRRYRGQRPRMARLLYTSSMSILTSIVTPRTDIKVSACPY